MKRIFFVQLEVMPPDDDGDEEMDPNNKYVRCVFGGGWLKSFSYLFIS